MTVPNVRMIPDGKLVAQHTVNGRVYAASIVAQTGFIDVPAHDAATLSANGWVRAENGYVGPTASRPTGYIPKETRYIDTTVGAVIVWDGVAWRNTLTGAVA